MNLFDIVNGLFCRQYCRFQTNKLFLFSAALTRIAYIPYSSFRTSKVNLSGLYLFSSFIFISALNTDNRINFGPMLENIVYTYAAGMDYMISVGRIGKLECDFILRDNEMNYSYVQVAYTILESKDTEDKEYRSLEQVKWDNYPKYLLTTDSLLQKRNGIIHANLINFIKDGQRF